MRVSDAVKVDKEFRDWRKAVTLRQKIHDRMSWYLKHYSDRVLPLHQTRAADITAVLDREIAAEKLLYEIPPQVLIDTYLYNTRQRLRRAGRKKGHTEHCEGPFSSMPAEGDGGQRPRGGARVAGGSTPLLRMDVETITDWIFEGLPPPRKAQLSDLENYMAEEMTLQYHRAMAKQHYFTLMCEIAYRAKEGWYFVFNTLTVAPEVYSYAFTREAPYFRDYIRRVDRSASRAATGSVRGGKHIDFHAYLACTEQGSQNGRLHLHVLHAFRELPVGCTDPNFGKAQPTERCVYALRRHWEAGRSEPRMVRYSPNDAFGMAGYRWPLEKGEPLKVKSPLAVANYISKYIEQGYDKCLRKKLAWRVKKSQGLGHGLLNELLEPLSTSTLWAITTWDALSLKLNNTPIPLPLLRHLSLKLLHCRSSSSTCRFEPLTTIAKRCTPRLSPLHSLRASTQTILECSQRNSQFLLTLGLGTEDTSREALDELRTQLRIINDKYFRHNIGIVGTASASHTVYRRTKPAAVENGVIEGRDRRGDTHVG